MCESMRKKFPSWFGALISYANDKSHRIEDVRASIAQGRKKEWHSAMEKCGLDTLAKSHIPSPPNPAPRCRNYARASASKGLEMKTRFALLLLAAVAFLYKTE